MKGFVELYKVGVKVFDERGQKLSDIKTLREDAAAVADQADDIKARYLKLFKV